MLKLKRSTKKGVEIVFRKKNSRFSKNLWKGILFALAFHLFFLFLFRVINPINEDGPLLGPIAVEIDLGKSPSTSFATPKLTLSPIQDLESPFLPELPESALPSFRGEISFEEPDFSHLEKIPYAPFEEGV